MPEGLDIDHEKPLNGSMATYSQQLLLCTGKDDWPSKIEEGGEHNFANEFGQLLGRGGRFSDPFHRVAIANTSFKSTTRNPNAKAPTTSAYLLPDFRWFPKVSLDGSSLESFTKDHLTTKQNHTGHYQAAGGSEDATSQGSSHGSAPTFPEAMVLICGHGGRDKRCGAMGPLLRSEFHKVISGIAQLELETEEPSERLLKANSPLTGPDPVRVGLISHIGGHRFAGNIIVYIPPTFRAGRDESHPLVGKGIWYGRVEPKHVDGIVRETLLKGRVISELFRGGIDQDGKTLRI